MPEITWWGHATVTIADSGMRILTDPVLTASVGHLRRRRGPLPTSEALRADAVLISHLHGDHLHLRSLLRLDPSTLVVLPWGASRALPALRRLRDRNVVEVRAGEEVSVGPVRIEAVPALHDGRRHHFAGPGAAALGYVVAGQDRTYFAGDTDLFPEMASAVGGCDVALLPVGGWGPGLGAGHLNPVRAAEAGARVGAASAVPIHFGTLWPRGCDRVRPGEFFGPGREFAGHAARVAPGLSVHELHPGQTARLLPVR